MSGEAGRDRCWLAMVRDLGRETRLHAADEAMLARSHDERQHMLERELQTVATGYARRCRDAGMESANRWLAETTATMGRRDGQTMRRTIESMA